MEKKRSLPCSKKKNDKKMVSQNPEKCGPEKNEQKTVFPFFLTLRQCVISLTIQFMIIYTALAICRMAADSFGLKYGADLC